MKTTTYFDTSVMARRPYLKREWIEHVLSHPYRTKVQANGRIRRWAFIPELDKYLRVMYFQYHSDTDMLYIQLAIGVSTESKEVVPGIVLDFDERNQVIGIEIEDASTFIDLSKLEVSALPIVNLVLNREAPVGV